LTIKVLWVISNPGIKPGASSTRGGIYRPSWWFWCTKTCNQSVLCGQDICNI